MSKLAQIDAIQQELWDICEEEEWDIYCNETTNLMLNELELLYNPLGLRAFGGDRGGYGFRMVLLCGINYDNIPEG